MNINVEEIEERISKVKSKLLETVSWKAKKTRRNEHERRNLLEISGKH